LGLHLCIGGGDRGHAERAGDRHYREKYFIHFVPPVSPPILSGATLNRKA
jgi:hypothetical protein